MGLIEVEKKNTVKIDGISTDQQVAHLGTLGDQNLGELNLAPTTYEFRNNNVDAGMNGGRVKTEMSLAGACFSTLLWILCIVSFIVITSFIVLKIAKVEINIFPVLESYNLNEYNSSVRKCFFILSGMLLGTCILMLLINNTVIRTRFVSNYLGKIGIVGYSVFAVIINSLLFSSVILVFFKIVDKISLTIRNYYDNKIITESVNLGTVNLFKYAIIVVVVIFLVVNSFNVVSIIKDKNKFVFEEEM